MNALFDLAYDTQQSLLSLNATHGNVVTNNDAFAASPIQTPKVQQSQHSAHKSTKNSKSVSRTPPSNQNGRPKVLRKLVNPATASALTSKSKSTPPSSSVNDDGLNLSSDEAPNIPTKIKATKPIDSIEDENEKKTKEWQDEMRMVLEKQHSRKAKRSQPSTIMGTIKNRPLDHQSIESSHHHQVSENPQSHLHISPDRCHNPDRPWATADKQELVEWVVSRIESKRLGHKRLKKRNFHNINDEPSEFHYLNVLECQSELNFEDYQFLSAILDRSVPSLLETITSLFTPHRSILF